MTEGFSAIPNWMFRDKSIGGHALLVYGALASHSGPGGIHPSRDKIAEEARCSVRQVARALNELETLGVVVRVRRSNRRGQAASGYELRPNGRLAADEEYVSEVEDSQSLTGEVEDSQSLGEGLSVQTVPLIEEEPLKKNPESVFEEFWSIYPRHVGKAGARSKFLSAAKRTDPQLIVDGARRFVEAGLPEDERFIPHPSTWLNQGRWEDVVESVPVPSRPVVDEVRERWLAERGITFEEYLERKDEPGWVASLRVVKRSA